MDWNKLRDKFFKECTDASPNSGKNAGIRPVNLNAHNLFEWFRKECESKETSDESGNCIKHAVSSSVCTCELTHENCDCIDTGICEICNKPISQTDC